MAEKEAAMEEVDLEEGSAEAATAAAPAEADRWR